MGLFQQKFAKCHGFCKSGIVILLKIDLEQCVKIAVFGTRIGVKQLSNTVVNDDKYRYFNVRIVTKRVITLLKGYLVM